MEIKQISKPIQKRLTLIFSLAFFAAMVLIYFSILFIFFRQREKIMDRDLVNANHSVTQIVEAVADLSIVNHLKTEAEIIKETVGYIHTRGLEEGLSQEEIQKRASSFITGRVLGETGYTYVIDSGAAILVHPYEELLGTNVREYDFIQEQIRKREGYIEYLWQNPGEDSPREKALYMTYYEPWDWIISSSAYKSEFNSLLRVEDVRESISRIRVGNRGYVFLMDREGRLLIHPQFEGLTIDEMELTPELSKDFLYEIRDNHEGKLDYRWIDSDTGEIADKSLLYSYFPRFDWIVVSSVFPDEYAGVLTVIIIALGSIFLGAFVLFVFLAHSVSSMLAKPLKEIIEFLRDTSFADLSHRLPEGGQDEFALLAQRINRFLDTIETEKNDRLIIEEENRILAQFTNGNPYPVMRIDAKGFVLYVNRAGRDLMKLWKIALTTRIPRELKELIENSGLDRGDLEYAHRDRTYQVMFSYFENKQFYYLLIMDITKRKENEFLLLMSESVFSHTTEGILITDPEGVIIRVNPAFTDISGYKEEEVLGENPRILKSDHHDQAFYKEMWDSLLQEGDWKGEIWNRRKNGEAYPELLTINCVRDEQGGLLHFVGVFKDISDIKESEEKLKHQVSHDSLTGLPNRILLEDRLGRAIAHAERNGEALAVLFIDMDNFKHINDSLGHPVGDDFLKIISRRLLDACREEDTVARFGGDEFVILLTDLEGEKNVVDITRRLLKLLGEPLSLSNHDLIPKASIGITVYPMDGRDPQLLLKNADLAMYKAKDKGKGTYSLYNSNMNVSLRKRMDMETRLMGSLEKGEIYLHYQPKIDLDTMAPMGVEALVRWDNPEVGFVSPADFIPLAEETGFIMPLGDWILRESLKDLKEMRALGFPDLEMAVNLSIRQFWDKELLEKTEKVIQRSGVSPGSVNFEITENVAMEDSEEALEIMNRLTDLGVHLSIDDFGTGYSSYHYFRKFQAKTLKIDKSFIDELPRGKKTSAIVENLIDLGHTLNMEVVAEGVENREQYDFLKGIGCDVIQGFYFSRPLGKKDLMAYLQRESNGD